MARSEWYGSSAKLSLCHNRFRKCTAFWLGKTHIYSNRHFEVISFVKYFKPRKRGKNFINPWHFLGVRKLLYVRYFLGPEKCLDGPGKFWTAWKRRPGLFCELTLQQIEPNHCWFKFNFIIFNVELSLQYRVWFKKSCNENRNFWIN